MGDRELRFFFKKGIGGLRVLRVLLALIFEWVVSFGFREGWELWFSRGLGALNLMGLGALSYEGIESFEF